MPFPAVQRVIYEKNPLDQVICQLRFPPILNIETKLPADFQDQIRTVFPDYVGKLEPNLLLPSNVPAQMPMEIVRQVIQDITRVNHEFSSEDQHWKVNLTRNFVALTTNKYERWEHFIERFQIPLNALISSYSPKYFSRIGLRYTDVIRRSKVGLENASWRQLLKPHLLGLLADTSIGDTVTNFESVYQLTLPDSKGAMNMKTMFVQPVDSQEPCYVIDSDFFTQRTEPQSAIDKLEILHMEASRLIRWCITDQLHEAMGPHPL